MQDNENGNPGELPDEGSGALRSDGEKLISEADVREMFGEDEKVIRRRKRWQARRRSMPNGEIRDPLENLDKRIEEQKRRREKGIDVPDFMFRRTKKSEVREEKHGWPGFWRGEKKREAERKEEQQNPANAEDMIDIDELKEKVKNDDGRMSTPGFLIAMVVLFVSVFAIVMVTFAVSRMTKLISDGVASVTSELSGESTEIPLVEQESVPSPTAHDQLSDPDVLAALAYSATPEEVSDISTRDLSLYLSEMPEDGKEIVSTDSDVDYTYERMVRDLYYLTVRFPNLIMMNTVGTTKDGRAIYDAVVGDPSRSCHILVVYTQHGSEHINTQVAMRQLQYVLTTWSNGGSYVDKTFSDIFSDVCFHIVPMANPDGVTIAQLGVDGLRTESARRVVKLCYELDKEHGKAYGTFEEYLAKFKANANGVDLNKNFDAGWGELDNNVKYPSTDGYKGSSAVSEPETQAILSIADNYPIQAVISVHSPGDRIIWNYGAEGDVLSVGKSMAETLNALTKYGMVEESHYTKRVAGGIAEYFVSERNIPAVSIMTGVGTLPVDMSYFGDIFGHNLNVIPAIAYLCDDLMTGDEDAEQAVEAAAEASTGVDNEDVQDGYDTYEDEETAEDGNDGDEDQYYDENGNE